MNFKVTVISCEEMTIENKKYYKVFAVLPEGGIVRVRGIRNAVKAGEQITVKVTSKGEKFGFDPQLSISF